MYLCFRKSLIKQHIIAYDPEVLSWHRVREPSVDFEPTDSENVESSDQENTAPANKSMHSKWWQKFDETNLYRVHYVQVG